MEASNSNVFSNPEHKASEKFYLYIEVYFQIMSMLGEKTNQKQVSEILGVHESHFRKYKLGALPIKTHAHKLYDIGCNVNWILDQDIHVLDFSKWFYDNKTGRKISQVFEPDKMIFQDDEQHKKRLYWIYASFNTIKSFAWYLYPKKKKNEDSQSSDFLKYYEEIFKQCYFNLPNAGQLTKYLAKAGYTLLPDDSGDKEVIGNTQVTSEFAKTINDFNIKFGNLISKHFEEMNTLKNEFISELKKYDK